jgi:hypothetical protein
MLLQPTEPDLGTAGEKHVAALLTALGYSCRQDSQQPGSIDLMATGPANLLIHIKTSLYPTPPGELTGEERCSLAARAASLGCQAWFAMLRVNSIGAPVGEISWGKIAN